MGLVEADLGSWCACEYGNQLVYLHMPHLSWRAGPLRSFSAIRQEAGLFCGSFLRKGEVFVYVGRFQDLKDL